VKGKQQGKKKTYCEGPCGHKVVKERHQEKKNIVKVLVATWRFEILDCVLSP